MSLVLAYDCAVSGLAIALVRDGAPLAVHREAGREQASRLLPAIAELLDRAGIEKRALEMIAVTVGPGSFTGVRVGLAAARGLAVALGIPLAGFATTAVLLAQAADSDRTVVAAVDTHLGDWFCAIRSMDQAPFLASTEALRERLLGAPALIVGAEAPALASTLNAEALEALPDPVVLAKLAEQDGAAAWQARNLADGLPGPLYLRGVNITLPTGERRTVE